MLHFLSVVKYLRNSREPLGKLQSESFAPFQALDNCQLEDEVRKKELKLDSPGLMCDMFIFSRAVESLKLNLLILLHISQYQLFKTRATASSVN